LSVRLSVLAEKGREVDGKFTVRGVNRPQRRHVGFADPAYPVPFALGQDPRTGAIEPQQKE